MSDTEQNGVSEETEEQAPESTETPETETPETATEEQGEKSSPENDWPEAARTELARVRAEAADRRVKLREAQEALSKAKTPEEFEAATKELTNKVNDLERTILVSSVASKHSLPPELAEVLKGDTEEELTAHAKKLAKFAQSTESEPETLRGGLNPSDSDDSFDPVAASRKARQSRY